MRLKSETKQVIFFLKHRLKAEFDGKTVAERCKVLNLNIDMVNRGLLLLRKHNIITRDSRGPNSGYIYPEHIGLGSVIEVIDGFECIEDSIEVDILKAINNIKL